MMIIKWWLWRRYLFIHWLKGMDLHQDFANNLYKVNFAGCRDNPSIHWDMIKIIIKRIK